MHGRAMPVAKGLADVLQQQAPQFRLPALRFGKRFARATQVIAQHVVPGRPVVQPVGAIDLVLVEQIGQALGQLVALARVVIVAEVIAQRAEGLALELRRQQPQQAPDQPGFVERRFGRDRVATQYRAIRRPQETAGQLHIDRGTDAEAALGAIARQRQLEPLGDAVALHQHHFVLERRQRLALQPAGEYVAQFFQTVAMQHHQARRDRRGASAQVGLPYAASMAAFVLIVRDGQNGLAITR